MRDFADSIIELVDGLPQKRAEEIEAHKAGALARLEEAVEIEKALKSLRASQRQYGKEPVLFGPDAAYDRSVAESYVFAQSS